MAASAYDLTARMAPFLDRHLLFPLLEFASARGLFDEASIQRTKVDLLAQTNMVDYAADVWRAAKGTEPPAEFAAKREEVVAKLQSLQVRFFLLYGGTKRRRMMGKLSSTTTTTLEPRRRRRRLRSTIFFFFFFHFDVLFFGAVCRNFCELLICRRSFVSEKLSDGRDSGGACPKHPPRTRRFFSSFFIASLLSFFFFQRA